MILAPLAVIALAILWIAWSFHKIAFRFQAFGRLADAAEKTAESAQNFNRLGNDYVDYDKLRK